MPGHGNDGSRLKPLAESMKSALDPAEWGRQRYLPGLTRRWPDLVGSVYANHSLPAFFRRDELWIYSKHAIWIQQMQFAKLKLLAKINEFLEQYNGPRVGDLRWMLQPADFPSPPPEKPPPLPPVSIDPEAEQAFKELTEGVEDVEARQALFRLWQKMHRSRRQ
ncbi:DUF721 domain-containing protein [Candidatus Electronema halotolerans]|jgi:hypothetical protein